MKPAFVTCTHSITQSFTKCVGVKLLHGHLTISSLRFLFHKLHNTVLQKKITACREEAVFYKLLALGKAISTLS